MVDKENAVGYENTYQTMEAGLFQLIGRVGGVARGGGVKKRDTEPGAALGW